ncbi:MAG: hypothetical protein AAFV43_04960 [Planctomycetota bacterium]
MSAAETDQPDLALEYRSLHTGAIAGVILGAVSAVVLLTAGSSSLSSTLSLSTLPLVGLVVSVASWRSIAGAPDVYTGARLAKAGAALSVLFLVSGVGYASLVYATEVPEGYERTSFLAMKPSDSDQLAGRLVPDKVLEPIESEKPVFIKGYIRPDSAKYTRNISNFLLVRDNQECCFGDLSKVQFFDQIRVRLEPGLTTDLSRKLFRVGGVLRVGPGERSLNAPLTYYLEADYIQ